jgi:hypothetical protein
MTTEAPRKRTTTPRQTSQSATTSGVQGEGRATQKTLAQHLATMAEAEVLTPEGLHEFLEAMRALSTGMAFFVSAASTQLDAAMRKGARDNKDGRLTMADKVKLVQALRKTRREMGRGAGEALLSTATSAVKAYSYMEQFLDDLESTQVQRPHRNSRGGFSVHGN